MSMNECGCGTTLHIIEWKAAQVSKGSKETWRRSLRKSDIYVVYVIEVQKKGKMYTISRRFSEFYSLNEKIKQHFVGITLSFPSRTLIPPYDKESLDIRQSELDVFLKHIADHKRMCEFEPVIQFLLEDPSEEVIDGDKNVPAKRLSADTSVQNEQGRRPSVSEDQQPVQFNNYNYNYNIYGHDHAVQIGTENTQHRIPAGSDPEGHCGLNGEDETTERHCSRGGPCPNELKKSVSWHDDGSTSTIPDESNSEHGIRTADDDVFLPNNVGPEATNCDVVQPVKYKKADKKITTPGRGDDKETANNSDDAGVREPIDDKESDKDDMKNDKDQKKEVCEADGKKPGEDAKGCKRDSTVISDNGTTRSENIKRTGERRDNKKGEPDRVRRQKRPEHSRRHKRRDKKEECCSVQ